MSARTGRAGCPCGGWGTHICPLPPDWDLFDRVRALKIHDEEHRCYVPPVIGWWDRLGYTHCLACPPEPLERDARGYPNPIHADNSAAMGCRCDSCDADILAAALEAFPAP